MKKENIIKIVIIVVLSIILGILVYKTVELNNGNNQPRMEQKQMNNISEGNMQKPEMSENTVD